MKIKNSFIKDLMDSMLDDYKFDLYEPIFIVSNGNKAQKYYINNTINMYLEHHPEFNVSFLKDIKNTLIDIVKDDIIIDLNNKLILKELYKIIFWIDCINRTLDIISDKHYPKKYFAGYQSDNREIKKEMNKNKGMIVNSRTKLVSKGENRLNWWFHNILNKNKKLTKFYLNMFTLIDIEKCTFIEKEDEEVVEKFFNFLNSKMVQIITDNIICKSLSILLYHEFKYYLKIDEKEIEPLITNIMLKLYNYEPNYEEFNKTIYLRSTIEYFPIFGAKRTSQFTKKEKDFIRSNMLKDYKLNNKDKKNNNKNFDYKSFDLSLELLLKKPHTQFLMKYPVEFFRKNPKYSTIKN